MKKTEIKTVIETVVTFTCDKCGEPCEEEQVFKWDDWDYSDNWGHTYTVHLCRECGKEMVRFLIQSGGYNVYDERTGKVKLMPHHVV